MTVLIANDLAKLFGARVVFKAVTFAVGMGEVMCVIGRNGEGKTTLLRVLAGEFEQDEGSCQVVGKRSMGYLSQEPPVFTRSVLEEMLSSRTDLQILASKIKSLEQEMALCAVSGEEPEQGRDREFEPGKGRESGNGAGWTVGQQPGHSSSGEPGREPRRRQLETVMEEYSRATTRFESLGGYAVESRAKGILSGLGLSHADFAKSTGLLSGGETIRLALAKLLLREPDVLLLDEPTNHLDLAGIEWLEKFLSGYRGGVLMVSHDRYFIDRVASKILELEGGEGKVYNGNYSAYLKQKEMESQVQEEVYRRQQELIARTRAFIQKWKATPTRKNQAWSRQKMLDRLDLVEKPRREQRAMRVSFDLNHESGNEVLSLREVGRSFPVIGAPVGQEAIRTLFKDLTWMVRKGDRVALVGPNGCGKTTLIRCILGEDDGYRGAMRFGQNVVTGYFSQDLDDLRNDATVLEEIRKMGLDNREARDLLGRFLFSGEEVEKEVRFLSGGERNRLSLAKLVVGRANVLILDEPTNHLDMASREALESAIRDFPGALIFASHDRYFIDRLATHLWLFMDGRVRVFKGIYSDYRRRVESGEKVIFEDELPSFALTVGKRERKQEHSQRR